MDLAIANDTLGLVVTTSGGCVRRFVGRREDREVSLFREVPAGATRTAPAAGCFPLVPFGNRVRGNRFEVDGEARGLAPNVPGEAHYLHGDGWLSEWTVLDRDATSVQLAFQHRGSGTPYAYDAEQRFVLEGETLTLTLAVTNLGPETLPFGLGWHPFLPLTPQTTLRARSRSYWDQDDAYLPTREHPVVGDLDFATSAPVPRRWLNTAFTGWDGQAEVRWPEHDATLVIDADPLFDRFLVFNAGPPGEAADPETFFCFEPMSHGVDAHNAPDGGGLRRLAPGETLEGSVRFTAHFAPPQPARRQTATRHHAGPVCLAAADPC